jgi:hypothetical protein
MIFYRSLFFAPVLLISCMGYAQVDTTFIYDPVSSLGVLDLRLSKTPRQYYYLKEDQTFSFREINGKRTNTYLNMTAWDSKPYTEGNLREVNGGTDSFVMNYRLLKPSAYDKNFAKGYPLVIVLHGLLERGNCAESKCYHGSIKYSPNTNNPAARTSTDEELLNNDYNLVHGGLNYLEASSLSESHLPDDPNLPPRGFSGFVVFPQNLNGWDDLAVEDAIRIVRLLIKKYKIDQDRIYINGVSHGGHGAYKAITRAPWMFAAGVLFSAADDAGILGQGLGNTIAGIPLWLFQGGKDLKPTQATTERYAQQLRSKGASVRYTLYPQLGHGTWNKAFSEPDFFSWLLRHKKNDIHVYADNPVICSTSKEGALLSLPDGYASYEWEHNGIIVGTQPKIVALEEGSYRARFLRQTSGVGAWSEWSDAVDVKKKDAGIAVVNLAGTRFLPDPNGSDTICLQAEAKYDIYNWYKDNNTRLRFEDTTSNVTLRSSLGDGKYFLKASAFDNCVTQPSVPHQIYFSDRAPFSIQPPTALQVNAVSPSSAKVTWTDNSADESGFEIWRRRKVREGEFEDWQLAALVNENTSSLIDSKLMPSSYYEYQIRAVAEMARSVYFPSSTESPVSVTTQNDTQPPTAPQLITAEQTGIEAISLSWKPSSDNSSVLKYRILLNGDTITTPSNDTTTIVGKVIINTSYSVRVVAVDAANNLSEPSNEISLNTAVNGLFYQHATGAWETLDEIDWSLAEFKGNVSDFTLSPKTQQDFFNFRFDGFLRIIEEGIYQFRISSDDGSSLSLDDSVLVVNDGIHTLTTTTSPIQLLASGPHRIQVDFFDYTKSDSLIVEYKGPDSGNQWMSIPAEAFTSVLITDVESEISDENFVSVFPNPTTPDNINISITDQMSPAIISLSNATGQLLNREEIIHVEFERGYRLHEIKSLLPGLYLLTIQQGNQTRNVRLIIK